jgi:hypothetical protein
MANSKISALTSATTPLAGTETLPVVQSSTTKQVSVANLTAGRAVSAASLALTTSPLPATSGGTGSSGAFVANGIGYASSTTTLTTNSALTWDGSQMLVKANERIYFDTYTNATTHAGYVGRNTSTGNLEIGTQTIGGGYPLDIIISGTNSFSFDSANNLIQKVASKGINFTANTPAAGMTSQLLNWYEEGTWTPTQGAGLTVVGAFSSAGTYTRIGRLVTVKGNVNGATSIIVASGSVLCAGLPFTSSGNSVGSLTVSNINQRGNVVTVSSSIYSAQATTVDTSIIFTVTYNI